MNNGKEARRKTMLAGIFGLISLTLLVSLAVFLKNKHAYRPYQPSLYAAGTPYEELPEDCNDGEAVEGSVPIEYYCYRLLQDSIAERVETFAGMLLVRADQSLWLDYKKLAESQWIKIQQGFPEKDAPPSLFIVNISPIPSVGALADDYIENKFNYLHLHVVDVGVTPPFVSPERLPITGVRSKRGDREILGIKKIDENTYILSGETLPEKGKKAMKLSVRYSRQTRDITQIK